MKNAAVELLDEVTFEKAPPKEKETPEDIKKRARKPPSDGPCKGCGKNLPLNRLMLCFRCWLKKKLIDEGKASGKEWIPGDPHPLSPEACGCNLPEHFGGPRE